MALYARQDPFRFATITAAEIAATTDTSDATVARAARKLGYKGTREWKRACAEQVDHTLGLEASLRSKLADLPDGDEKNIHLEAARSVLSSAAEALLALSDGLEASTLETAIGEIADSDRVFVYGRGTGYYAAEYLSLGMTRIGIEARACTGSGHTLADVIPNLRHSDVSIVIAPRIIIPDLEWYLAESVSRCSATILISAEFPPTRVRDKIVHIALPSTEKSLASDTLSAIAVADVLTSEMSRLNPARALKHHQMVQELRESIYQRQRGG